MFKQKKVKVLAKTARINYLYKILKYWSEKGNSEMVLTLLKKDHNSDLYD